MVAKIKVEKVAAGFYQYTFNGKTVEVTQIEPNPAYGDTKPMWIAAAMWDRNRYTDPMETKRQAVEQAKNMLESA